MDQQIQCVIEDSEEPPQTSKYALNVHYYYPNPSCAAMLIRLSAYTLNETFSVVIMCLKGSNAAATSLATNFSVC